MIQLDSHRVTNESIRLFVEDKRSEKTKYTYANFMWKYMTRYEFISKQDLKKWFSETTKEISKKSYKRYSSATINQGINILKSYCKFCMEYDYLDYNPSIVLKCIQNQANPYKPLKAKNRRKILVARNNRLKFIPYVKFMMLTGVRLEEASKIHKFEFDTQTQTLSVVGKGSKMRKLLLGDLTLSLYELIVNNPASSFSILRRGLDKTLCRLGIYGVSSHCLRATFATQLYESGVGLVNIQRLLGHSSIDTTRKYIHQLQDLHPERIPEEAFLGADRAST